ncbi:MAG TPA: hypothetical protein VK014_06500 [Cyclobacteriaceae bacterium]|nr:hypothetical protein [Cyclobacteriaceae bacterium]
MNLKNIFGTVLTILGIGGLIYGASLFLSDSNDDWKTTLVAFALGLIFFTSGLGLIKRTG